MSNCNCTAAIRLSSTFGLLCEMGTVSAPLFEYLNQTLLTAAASAAAAVAGVRCCLQYSNRVQR